jgi:hypothetical protein
VLCHELLEIAPDLRCEAAPAGLEDADHGPLSAPETQPFAEARVEAARDALAGHDLRGAGTEHATGLDPHLWPERKPDLG